jgi:hypothetical protein
VDWLNPPLAYKPSGPIYPLVLSYLAQLHGFIELASRGLFLVASGVSTSELDQLVARLPEKNAACASRVLKGGVTQLLDEPSAASLVDQSVKVDVSQLARTVFSDSEPVIRNFNLQSAGSLLVLAWEHTEDIHTNDPLWEFLRHLRNAVAHGGRFHFLYKEPVRPAIWRSKSIDRSLQDAVVFGAPVDTGFLAVGDVLHLLADIDTQFVR